MSKKRKDEELQTATAEDRTSGSDELTEVSTDGAATAETEVDIAGVQEGVQDSEAAQQDETEAASVSDALPEGTQMGGVSGDEDEFPHGAQAVTAAAPVPRPVPRGSGSVGGRSLSAIIENLKASGHLNPECTDTTWTDEIARAYKAAYYKAGGTVFAGVPTYVPEPTPGDAASTPPEEPPHYEERMAT